MICKYCEKEFAQGRVCPHCGKAQKGKLTRVFSAFSWIPVRYWMCFLVLVAALGIAALIFSQSLRPDPYIRALGTITQVYDGDKTQFYYNARQVGTAHSGRVAQDATAASLTGDVVAFLDGDELYLVNKKGVNFIADEVVYFQLSPSGQSVAYLDEDDTLYRYNCGSKKSQKLDDDVLASCLCIAPDGTVAYLKQNDGEEVMYYCTGKKPRKYSTEGRFPLAVSNGAKRLYVTDSSDNLYCSNGKKETEIGRTVTDGSVCFSHDFKQVLFVSNGQTYLWKGKGESVKIADVPAQPLQVNDLAIYNSRVALANDLGYVCCGVRSFAQRYYVDSDGDLIYVDSKLHASTLKSDVTDSCVTENGKWAFCLCDGTLLRMNTNGRETTIAENVKSYVISDDGRYVYYSDDSDVLYVKHGRIKSKQIATGVTDFVISAKNYLFYMNSDGLFSVQGSSKMRSITAEYDADSVGVLPYTVSYIHGDKIYMSAGDAKFSEKQSMTAGK